MFVMLDSGLDIQRLSVEPLQCGSLGGMDKMNRSEAWHAPPETASLPDCGLYRAAGDPLPLKCHQMPVSLALTTDEC